ncbi:MAG: hypothetical protein WD852_05395 [Methyloceanibacter sp.]
MAKQILPVMAALVTLSGCGEAYDRQIKTLETVIQWIQVGNSNDYWLEMKNALNQWERVALVFGYWDDYEGCKDIIRLLGEENYAREYRCVPAN